MRCRQECTISRPKSTFSSSTLLLHTPICHGSCSRVKSRRHQGQGRGAFKLGPKALSEDASSKLQLLRRSQRTTPPSTPPPPHTPPPRRRPPPPPPWGYMCMESWHLALQNTQNTPPLQPDINCHFHGTRGMNRNLLNQWWTWTTSTWLVSPGPTDINCGVCWTTRKYEIFEENIDGTSSPARVSAHVRWSVLRPWLARMRRKGLCFSREIKITFQILSVTHSASWMCVCACVCVRAHVCVPVGVFFSSLCSVYINSSRNNT